MSLLNRITVDLGGAAVQGGGQSHFFFTAAGGTAADAASAVAEMYGDWQAYMTSATTWAINPVVSIVESTTNDVVDITTVSPLSGSGTDSSGQAPPVLQGLAQWRTGVFESGRELRGRTYIPGVPKGTITSTGVPAGTYIEAIQTAGAALLADANSVLVTYSPTHLTFAVVDSVTCWTKWAELRSRRD